MIKTHRVFFLLRTYTETGGDDLKKKIVCIVFLLLLCGCGRGSMKQGNLDMERTLIEMAETMREEQIGAIMNEHCLEVDILKEVYGLVLTKTDFACIQSIRQDVWQEAAIFHCKKENRSIIKEKVDIRYEQARQQGIPAYLGSCNDYLYLVIGNDAQWMRAYLERA